MWGYEYCNGFVFVEIVNGFLGWVIECYFCGSFFVGSFFFYICGVEMGWVYLCDCFSNSS